jgi:aspartokinase/homoserine dehydrogenase 1
LNCFVVSALGGVTDRLLLAADFALNTNPGYQSVLEEIIFRHHEMIEKMVPSASDKQELKQKIEPMFEDLRNIR